MNLALGSIILFLVLLPGIIFRSSYLSSSFSRKVIDKKPIDDIFFAILPAILFHLIWIFCINTSNRSICGVRIDVDFLLKLSTNSANESYYPISNFVLEILLYNVSLIIVAFLLGHLSRKIVRHLKWDRTTNLFRFTNKWHYIFTGEILDFPNIPDESNEVDHIHLDILSDINGQMIIYSGEYLNHSLGKDGDLENIILRYPSKKRFNNKEDEFIEIPSKFFLIPYSTIKNLNVRYFAIEEATEAQVNEYEKTRSSNNISHENDSGIEGAVVIDD